MTSPLSSSGVPVDAYTESYYLNNVGGVEFFRRYGFEVLKPDTQAAVRAARLRPGDGILDVGCGRGELVAHLTRKGFDVLGMDYAPEAIKIAKNLCPEARYRCGELDQLSLPPAGYDVIFFLGTIQHLTSNQIDGLLRTLRTLLKPGGQLVVTTCDNPLYYKRLTYRWREGAARTLGRIGVRLRRPTPPVSTHDKVVHVKDYTPGAIKHCGERAGWAVRVEAKLNPKLELRKLYGSSLPKDFPVSPAPAWKRALFRCLSWYPVHCLFARNYLAVLTPR